MVILDTKYYDGEGEKPEGRLQFRIYEEYIVQYTLSGPVDRLLMEHFALIHKEAVAHMKKGDGSWGSFVVFHDATCVTDGALDELGNYLSSLGRIGKLSSHMAVVYPFNTALSSSEQDAFCRCLTDVGVTCQSFALEDEALEWLRLHTGK